MFEGFLGNIFPFDVAAKAGRKKGGKNKHYKLDKHKQDIEHYLKLGLTVTTISKLLEVHRLTVSAYINNHPEVFGVKG